MDIFNSYQLGIIWSIGSYNDIDNRITFRHKNKYFLEQLYIDKNTIFPQQARTDIQYVLKTFININQLKDLGWTERNSVQRDLPILEDYKDFIRAYLEIHSAFSWQTSYLRNKRKYYRVRLRIFGNYILIESINNLLAELKIIEKKKVQDTHNDTTAYIQLTSLEELNRLFDYIDKTPKCLEFWNEVDLYLNNPKKYI